MASEFHKEDALRCLSVAKKAAKEGDTAKAEKFALKAKKLCDCPEVNAFLGELNSQNAAGPSTKGPTLRQRPSRAQDQGTEEQRALVAKIRKAKDFYEILDVTQEATEDDIKRAYKKLALKLHPDKNKAPGAEEAFKSVSRAFTCLSDPEKKQNYDRYGTEDRMQAGRPGPNEFYTNEIDPEELFNMFFGGGFPMGGNGAFTTHFRARTVRRRNGSDSPRHNDPTSVTLTSLFSFLPLLLFFVLTFFAGGGDDQVFSLYREYPFEHELTTERHQIPFFVRSKVKFDHAFPIGSRQRVMLEDKVEVMVKRVLEDNCRQEKNQRRRIRTWRGKEAAEQFQLKSCFKLNEVFYSGSKRTVKSR